MSSFYKLKALVKKNFLEMRRNIFSTIFEIFLPIILISLFWLLKTAYDIDNIKFEKEENNIGFKYFIQNRSVVNKDFDSDVDDQPDSWYGLSTEEPIFDICEYDHYKQAPFPRPIIGIVNIPKDLEKIFRKKLNYTIEKKGFKDKLYYKKFDTVEKMEEEVKKNKKERICFGISFENKTDDKLLSSLELFFKV